MHQKGSVTFARVHPGGQDHGASQSDFFWSAQEVCDNDHFAVITSESLAEYGLADLILCLIRAEAL